MADPAVKVLVVRESGVEAALARWLAEQAHAVSEVVSTARRVVRPEADPLVAVTILYRPA